jgi:hypothetical protein
LKSRLKCNATISRTRWKLQHGHCCHVVPAFLSSTDGTSYAWQDRIDRNMYAYAARVRSTKYRFCPSIAMKHEKCIWEMSLRQPGQSLLTHETKWNYASLSSKTQSLQGKRLNALGGQRRVVGSDEGMTCIDLAYELHMAGMNTRTCIPLFLTLVPAGSRLGASRGSKEDDRY